MISFVEIRLSRILKITFYLGGQKFREKFREISTKQKSNSLSLGPRREGVNLSVPPEVNWWPRFSAAGKNANIVLTQYKFNVSPEREVAL